MVQPMPLLVDPSLIFGAKATQAVFQDLVQSEEN